MWFVSQIGNRELAAIIWIALILIACFASKEIRPSLLTVLRAALHPYILSVFIVYSILFGVCIIALNHAGIWKPDQSFATVFWFVTTGIVIIFRSVSPPKGEHYFLELAKDSVRVTVAFEFVAVAYSLSLFYEVILLPILFVLGMMSIMSKGKKEHAAAASLVNAAIFIIVGCMVLFSLSEVVNNWEELFTSSTARNFVMPVFLTFFSIPVGYMLYCVSTIQTASRRLELKVFQTDELRAYAKRRFLFNFGWRPKLFERAASQFYMMPAMSREHVEDIIRQVRKHSREKRQRHSISGVEGWNPYEAEDFLKSENMGTNDYHNTHFDGEWWAQSEPSNIDSEILPNTATYSIAGIEGTVQKLTLTGHFYKHESVLESTDRFKELARVLMISAGVGPNSEFDFGMEKLDSFELVIGKIHVRLENSAYPAGGGFRLCLDIEYHPNSSVEEV